MAAFSLSRSTRIHSDRATVHALIDDFRQWQRWSPWEGVDPDLRRDYSGPGTGVGAAYRWSGNSKAGEGEMRITASSDDTIVVDLVFLKPFRATNVTTFTLAAVGDTTDLTWTMAGSRNPLMSVAGRLFLDKAIGRDFDKGLAALKREAELAAGSRPA